MTSDASQNATQTSRVIETLRRRLWIVVICLIAGGLVAFVSTQIQSSKYSATAALLFQQDDLSQQLFGYSTTSTINPTTADETYVQLAQEPAVGVETAKALGISAARVAAEVTVAEAGTSDVVNVTATDVSPEFAARIANTYARKFVQFREAAQRAQVQEAADQLQSQITRLRLVGSSGNQANNLEVRLSQLRVLTAIQTGDVQQAQVAQQPSGRSSPRPKKDTAIGLLIGLFVGLLAAFVADRLDQSLRDPDEIRDITGLPVLGTIPASRELSRTASTKDFVSNRDAEPFRLLRSQLTYFNVDRRIDSVLITSAAPGDGKSTVAWNLARAAALVNRGQSVLLLDADLRAPTISTLTGLPVGPGLAELLTQDLTFEEVVRHVDLSAGAGGSQLDVITAGADVPNPSELMESKALRELVADIKSRYDFVVFDAAPTTLVADAIPLLTQVSGVLVVVRIGRTRRAAVRRLRDHLAGINNIHPLGLVLNGMKSKSSDYYRYSYGYGHERRASEDLSDASGPQAGLGGLSPSENQASAQSTDRSTLPGGE